MKDKHLLIIGLALAMSALSLTAQTAVVQSSSSKPSAFTPDPSWRLSQQQLAQRREIILKHLRTKRANGTLTQVEKGRLECLEQAGAVESTGSGRGGGRPGLGRENGTGPRAATAAPQSASPLLNQPPAK